MSRNVSPKKTQAIEIMLTGVSLTEAAAQLKVNRKTLSRWLSEADFQQEFREARRQVAAQANARIIGLMDTAVTTIKTSLDGTKVGKERFLGAKLIIQTAHAIEADNLLARVEALEQQALDRRTRLDRELEDLTLEELEKRLQKLEAMEEGLSQRRRQRAQQQNEDGETP
jgi:hypothetical protein